MINVTIFNEFLHEQNDPEVAAIYPDGIHGCIADGLREHLGDDLMIRIATLDEPEHGLPEDVLNATDVLLWWGHQAHDKIEEGIVDRVQSAVLNGMGFIALHSAHYAKPFKQLLGTSCSLRWREAGEKERLWIVDPGHPIVEGIEGEYFELPHTEMYGEHFDIPQPDELVMISWFEGGEVFRSCVTYRRGKGKVAYFRPGHETYPIYYDANIRRVLANMVRWAQPNGGQYHENARNIDPPIETLG